MGLSFHIGNAFVLLIIWWYLNGHGDHYVLSDMIIDIDFLFLSFILHSWSNLVLLSKINIFVWFNEYRGRWPIKHMKCVPWHCPPKQCGLTLQPTPAASRLGWFRCLPPFLRLTKHQTGVQLAHADQGVAAERGTSRPRHRWHRLGSSATSRRALCGPGESARMLVSSALAASGAQGTSGLWHPAQSSVKFYSSQITLL